MERSNRKRTKYAPGLRLGGANQRDDFDYSKYPYDTAVGKLRYFVYSARPDLEYIKGALSTQLECLPVTLCGFKHVTS